MPWGTVTFTNPSGESFKTQNVVIIWKTSFMLTIWKSVLLRTEFFFQQDTLLEYFSYKAEPMVLNANEKTSNHAEMEPYYCALKFGFTPKNLSRIELLASVVKTKKYLMRFWYLNFWKKKESLIWHKLFQTLEVFSINLENKQVLEVRNSLKFCKVSTRISFWLPFFRMPRWLLRCFLKKRVLFFPYWSQAICEANMIVMVFEKLCTLIYFTASGLF